MVVVFSYLSIRERNKECFAFKQISNHLYTYIELSINVVGDSELML